MAASLNSVPMVAKAKIAEENQMAESKTTLTIQSILRDIKNDVSAEDVDNYSAEDIMQLWKQLQPELTEEFINKCGEKNVQQFVAVALQYIRLGNISKVNFRFFRFSRW